MDNDVKLSKGAWKGIGLALLFVGVSCGVCGLLFGALTTETAESTVFWITRGCFVGPAFAMGFLAYGALMVGRRRGHSVRCGELITASGVSLGLIPVFLGLALMLQPTPESDDAAARAEPRLSVQPCDSRRTTTPR